MIRDLDQPVRILNSFFVVTAVRRSKVGTDFAKIVLEHYPGRWAVAYQDAHEAAARFWPAVATTVDNAARHQYRAVPGRSDLPPDSWFHFTSDAVVRVTQPPSSELE